MIDTFLLNKIAKTQILIKEKFNEIFFIWLYRRLNDYTDNGLQRWQKKLFSSSDNQFYVDGLLIHDEINSIIIAMVAIQGKKRKKGSENYWRKNFPLGILFKLNWIKITSFIGGMMKFLED